MEFKKVNLYGGAITCEIPLKFDDLSTVLPVPDNQEVFVYHSEGSGNSSLGVSSYDYVLSFEIMENLLGLDDAEAGRKLFYDLSYCNESRESKICNLKVVEGADLGLSEPFNAVSISGTMEVCRSKYRKEEYNKIWVSMFDFRMPRYKCEFLVSYSYPSGDGQFQEENEKLFEMILKKVKVVDTKLFGI